MAERLESIGCQTCSREGRYDGLPKDEPHAPAVERRGYAPCGEVRLGGLGAKCRTGCHHTFWGGAQKMGFIRVANPPPRRAEAVRDSSAPESACGSLAHRALPHDCGVERARARRKYWRLLGLRV